MDAQFGQLPPSVHVFQTTGNLDSKPNIAWYIVADLKNKQLDFTVDTTLSRRLTPQQYYEKNDHPAVVVNCTFFSFATHQNLNTVIRDGKLLGYNIHTIAGRGKDTLTYQHPLTSAIGIDRKRNADIAWLYTDSSNLFPYASQYPINAVRDSSSKMTKPKSKGVKKWKMETAVGGGPVLVQNGKISISNNEELKFSGKAIDDKHPRTAMGYTKDGKLIILVIEGRNPGKAEGATLVQTAKLLQELGCKEALNLDGGGSSCMLVNGKTTIFPSDRGIQRPVPAVFIVKTKK